MKMFCHLALIAVVGVLGTPLLWSQAAAVAWVIEDQTPAQAPEASLIHERRLVTPASGAKHARKIDLVWFNAASHTFVVIDNGAESAPKYSSLADAVKSHQCLAGVNGGFFHKDYSPSGLMVAGSENSGTFGKGALLSGVLLSSGNRNPYLLRRAEYGPKYKETDLVQSGPFLVDQGRAVKGLSPENSRKRTFAIQAAGKWFALGVSDPLTLAELGDVLAHPDFSPGRPIQRALNLDGGTSTGIYYPGGGKGRGLSTEPIKRVRNFVGIVSRFR